MNYYRILYVSVSLFVSVFFSTLTFAQVNFWAQTNGPPGGEILSIAFNSSGHVFVGTRGVFRSLDGGIHWTQTNSGLTFSDVLTVNALAINNNGTIFAATRDSGIFLSTNNGNNWSHSSLNNIQASSLVVNSNNHVFAGSYFSGIFRSTDEGNTWVSINDGLSSSSIYALSIDTNGYIFAGSYFGGVFRSTNNGDSWTAVGLFNKWVYSLAVTPSADILAGTDSLFRSTDNGLTWSFVDIGLTTLYRLDNLAVSRSGNSSGYIFANVYDYYGLGGIFRSTNNGGSWTRINNGLSDSLNLRSLSISPIGEVFAGTENGLFKSTDDGQHWSLMGVPGSYITCLARASSTNLFAGTIGGIFQTTNYGDSWFPKNSGLTKTVVNSFVENSLGHFMTGTSNGIFLSTDNGNNWSQIALSKRSVRTLIVGQTNFVFAGTDTGVFRSSDNGTSWILTNSGLTNRSVRTLVINANKNIFAGTSGGIFRTTNNGDTWTFVSIGISSSPIYALAIDSNSYLFAGTGGGVYRSTNNGDGWTSINSGLSDTTVLTISLSSTNTVFAGTLSGVFRSTDNGDSWVSLNSGLSTSIAFVSRLLITPDGYIFAGTFGGGVFKSVQSITAIEHLGKYIPNMFTLEQNFPNPFNPSTTIVFSIPSKSFISLKVFDLIGREQATIVSEEMSAGIYTRKWNGNGMPSSVYFYRLLVHPKSGGEGGSFVETKKLILLK